MCIAIAQNSKGKIHNEILTAYYMKYGNKSLNSDDLIDNVIDIYITLYPKQKNEITNELKVMLETVLKSDLKSIEDYKKLVKYQIKYVEKYDLVSTEFLNFISKISTNSSNVSSIKIAIDNFKKANKLSKMEIELLNDFEEIYTFSGTYWDSKRVPGWAVRASDALGGIIGGLGGFGVGGPIGSVVGGHVAAAVMSIMVEEGVTT